MKSYFENLAKGKQPRRHSKNEDSESLTDEVGS